MSTPTISSDALTEVAVMFLPKPQPRSRTRMRKYGTPRSVHFSCHESYPNGLLLRARIENSRQQFTSTLTFLGKTDLPTTKQIPDTLPKPQLESRPDMRSDV